MGKLGRSFSEKTMLFDINPSGAGFLLKTDVDVDTQLFVHIGHVWSGLGAKAKVFRVENGATVARAGAVFTRRLQKVEKKS